MGVNISNAFPFYITIIIVSVLLMSFSQKWANGKLVKFRKVWFILSFVPLWYVSAFTSSGADYEQYAFICYDAAYRIQESYTEFGWNLLSLFFTFILKDPYKTLFVIQTLTLSLYIYAFYLIRKDVSLWLSLLAFEIFLFFNFGLMSIYLSVALVLLSIIEFTKNKYKSSIIFLLLACSFHSSALFWIPAYLLSFYANRVNWAISKLSAILMLAILVFIGMIRILMPILLNMTLFQHYASYEFEGNLSFGLGNMILYIMYFYLLSKYIKNKGCLNEKRFLLILVSISFAYMLIGYMIPTVTRMKFYTVYITAFFIPKALRYRYSNLKLLVWVLFLILYGGFGLYKTISTEEYLMSNWIFFNPW